MQSFPDIPRVADADVGSGHLWIQEWVTGGPLRFQLESSGLLRFGDDERAFDGGVPLGYRSAVRRVRSQFDRDALRDALDDPASVTFFGVATRRDPVAYDWRRLPGFLGFAAWDADADRFLPPDAVEKLYDRLGLTPLNAVQKEVRAVDFDPASYEIPSSAWRDGPAAGVLVRSKTGDRARRLGPAANRMPDTVEGTPVELAERFVTPERVEAAEHDPIDGEAATAGDVVERVVERVVREEYARLPDSLDADAFESAAASRVRRLRPD